MSEQSQPEVEQISTKRRMPETLRKYLLRMQGGKEYLPAAMRLVWFRDECPDWGIETYIVEGGQEAGFATVRAVVKNADGFIMATAHKTETQKDFPAGWVEKAESGAIARALAMCGFGTQFSAELDDDGTRPADSPQPNAQVSAWQCPGQCPRCKAPEGKPHTKACDYQTATTTHIEPEAKSSNGATDTKTIQAKEAMKAYAKAIGITMASGWLAPIVRQLEEEKYIEHDPPLSTVATALWTWREYDLVRAGMESYCGDPLVEVPLPGQSPLMWEEAQNQATAKAIAR